MKKILVFALIWAFFSSAVSIAQDWQWLNPKPQGNHLSSVFFINNDVGFSAGGGTLIKTEDGGEQWEIICQLPSRRFSSIFFIDEQVGYATGYYSVTSTTGFILKTTDGGYTWTSHEIESPYFMAGIYFSDSMTGYAVGGSSSKGGIYKTNDGGVTWQLVYDKGFNWFNAVSFYDSDHGMVVGGRGQIVQTSDAGVTWNDLSIRTSADFYAVDYVSGEKAYVAGGVWGEKTVIYKTIDAGANWVNVAPDGWMNMYGIKFFDENNGIAGGDSGYILSTDDGGQSWQSSRFASCEMFNTAFFLPDQSWVAAGSGGVIVKKSSGEDSGHYVSEGFNDELNSIVFPKPDVGFAIGTHQVGQIYKTTNGGLDWTPINTGGTRLQSCFFTNQNNGYIVGDEGKVVMTRDGGETWTTKIIGSDDILLFDVYFPDENTGYAVGRRGLIFKTSDGGDHWEFQESGTSDWLYTVYFLDANTGFAGGWYGTILYTTNGGQSWFPLETGTSKNIYSITFIDNLTGFAVGGFQTGAVILQTTDGGSSWMKRDYPDISKFNSVCFTYRDVGYVVGFGGAILTTIDGGLTWEPCETGISQSLNDITFSDAQTGYAVGIYGTILKTTSAGGLGTEAFKLAESRIRAYPNPAKDHIQIDLLKLSNRDFYGMYSLDGKLMIRGRILSQNVFVDLSSLKPGIYMLRIQNGDEFYSQKVVVK